MGGGSNSPPPMPTNIGSDKGHSYPVHPVYAPAPYVDLDPDYLAAVAPYLLDTNPFQGHMPDFSKLQEAIAKNIGSTHKGLTDFAKSLPTFDRQVVDTGTGQPDLSAYSWSNMGNAYLNGAPPMFGGLSRQVYQHMLDGGQLPPGATYDPSVDYFAASGPSSPSNYAASGILADGPITAVMPTPTGNAPYTGGGH